MKHGRLQSVSLVHNDTNVFQYGLYTPTHTGGGRCVVRMHCITCLMLFGVVSRSLAFEIYSVRVTRFLFLEFRFHVVRRLLDMQSIRSHNRLLSVARKALYKIRRESRTRQSASRGRHVHRQPRFRVALWKPRVRTIRYYCGNRCFAFHSDFASTIYMSRIKFGSFLKNEEKKRLIKYIDFSTSDVSQINAIGSRVQFQIESSD